MVIARGRWRRDSVALATEGNSTDLTLIQWSRDDYRVKLNYEFGEGVPCWLAVGLVVLKS